MNARLCDGRMNLVARERSRPGPAAALKAVRSASHLLRQASAGSASGVAGHAAVHRLASAPGSEFRVKVRVRVRVRDRVRVRVRVRVSVRVGFGPGDSGVQQVCQQGSGAWSRL